MNQTTDQTTEPKLNAHVIAKINDDYYKTSKVIVEKTNSIKINKCFDELKKILTYESQNKKITISYTDVNKKYEDRLQVIAITIKHLDENNIMTYRKIDLYASVFQDILNAIPKGFKLHGIESTNFFMEKKEYFDKKDRLSLELRISFMKETKYKF